MNKPVWRMNRCAGVPSDLGDEAIYRDGFVSELCGREKEIPSLWIVYDHAASYAAYQTTRTKAAKYTRKDCQVCEGEGKRKLKDWITKQPFVGVCIYCNGKGYRLERVE